MYRMGDLAVLHDGKITVTGRSDDTVKLNAIRVHLGEVNNAMMDAHPEFQQVHTVALRPPEKRKQVRGPVLVVLYIAERSIDPDVRSLIREIRFRVLMPNAPFLFFQVPSLPTQLHSGKVDRIARFERWPSSSLKAISKIPCNS